MSKIEIWNWPDFSLICYRCAEIAGNCVGLGLFEENYTTTIPCKKVFTGQSWSVENWKNENGSINKIL